MTATTVTSDVLLEDLIYLARQMRPDEIEQYLAMGGQGVYDPQEAALQMATCAGPKVVVLHDGLPVAAGGFIMVRPGVWEGWQAGTVAGWGTHWRTITKTTRRLNDQMLADPAVHRLQLCALAGRDRAFEWYERSLGYRQEAVLSRYCANGADAVMFTRIKEAA